MVHAIRIHETGGTEVLRWEEVNLSPPGAGELRIRHTAIGLNFIDIYHRTGIYPTPLPAVIGSEGVGVVEQVGPGVEGFTLGDRIAYASVIGADAEVRNIAADRAVKLPDDIDDDLAAACMLKGLTAHSLIRRAYPVKAGETILVHAAAGGTGLILCQWAKSLGATVIGTVGSREKAELAAANGCDHPVLYREVDFVEAVKDITKGQGLPVVYDSVGRDTFVKSLDCLAPFGMMVSYGQASGRVEPLDIISLARKGALYLTRPSLPVYIARREHLLWAANDLFEVLRSGAVKINITARYPLADAARAQADLERRQTTGSVILRP